MAVPAWTAAAAAGWLGPLAVNRACGPASTRRNGRCGRTWHLRRSLSGWAPHGRQALMRWPCCSCRSPGPRGLAGAGRSHCRRRLARAWIPGRGQCLGLGRHAGGCAGWRRLAQPNRGGWDAAAVLCAGWAALARKPLHEPQCPIAKPNSAPLDAQEQQQLQRLRQLMGTVYSATSSRCRASRNATRPSGTPRAPADPTSARATATSAS